MSVHRHHTWTGWVIWPSMLMISVTGRQIDHQITTHRSLSLGTNTDDRDRLVLHTKYRRTNCAAQVEIINNKSKSVNDEDNSNNCVRAWVNFPDYLTTPATVVQSEREWVLGRKLASGRDNTTRARAHIYCIRTHKHARIHTHRTLCAQVRNCCCTSCAAVCLPLGGYRIRETQFI